MQNLEVTLLFVEFSRIFDSIYRGKTEQILLAFSLPKENATAITMLNKNSKVKVRSPHGDTDFFEGVSGVLQGDTLAPHLFIICQDYVLRTSKDLMKENSFTLKKGRSRWYAQKLLRTRTTQMTWNFWQIHQPRLSPCCKVWSRQQEALVSMSVRQKGIHVFR